jgi:GPI mannosyltransferase 2
VGPFRYWTLSNLPLFLLAAPSLAVLTYSAVDILQLPENDLTEKSQSSEISSLPPENRLLKVLAIPQLVLAFLALTTYHVQIITRLSSGYPLWYIWLAMKAQKDPKKASAVLRWMVLYALIQAGLYASFLPPA